MLFKYFLLWFPMTIVAIINGTIRQSVYLKYLGDLRAHQLSTFTGILLFTLYIWLAGSWFKLESSSQALLVGVMWLVMTVAFEFLFGHYVIGHSWDKLLFDYNIMKGRVWLLVLIWLTIAPYLLYRFRMG